MFNRIVSFIQSIRPAQLHLSELPLEFDVDADDQDRWVVSAYYRVNGVRHQADLNKLTQYGYRLETDGEEFVVGEQDLQALLAVKSLNPQHTDTGAWLCEVEPPILSYVRKRSNLNETPKAAEFKVLEQAAEPKARVQLDGKNNMVVEIGYSVPGDTTKFVGVDEAKTVSDGRYVRLGKTFAPVPRTLSSAAREWLEKPRTVIPHDEIPEFFKRDLVMLRSQLGAVLVEPVDRVRIIDSDTRPRVTVDSTQPGWLDFQIDYTAGGVSLSAELIQSGTGQYVRPDALTWVRRDPAIVARTKRRLQALGAIETETGFRVPIERFGSLEEFINDVGGVREIRAAYQRFLDGLSDFKASTEFRLSEDLEHQLLRKGLTLYDHQRAGIHWLDWLRQNHLHGVLADDMGLGKTLQALLAMLLAYKAQEVSRHSLIVCPKSVMRHWAREIERIAPQQLTQIYHGPNRRRQDWNHSKPVVFISTYNTVVNDIETIQAQPLFYLILDEATAIKNPSTKRTEAVKLLNAAHRVALSGTPVENRPAELWSMFDFLMRGHLGTQGFFTRKYEEPIQKGDRRAAEELGRRVKPFVLRRMKGEVAKNLPKKIEMDEWCELTAEQRQLYVSIQNQHRGLYNSLQQGEVVNKISILPILTKLKQVCDHPALINQKSSPIFGRSEKFDWIVEKMKEIVAGGEQVVIFSHFLDMLSLLEVACQTHQLRYMRIDGSTPTGKRQALIDDFNRGSSKVALCSLQAVGYGVNLTAANHVIHADRWWNPAIERQATDRVHRIGQNKLVYVYRILVEDTLEEKIDVLLERKQGMADKVMGAATEGGLEWTREELLQILKPIG